MRSLRIVLAGLAAFALGPNASASEAWARAALDSYVELSNLVEAPISVENPTCRSEARPPTFEEGITRIEYVGGELAILHYGDGSTIRVPLAESENEPPFESVDCDTARKDLVTVELPDGLRGVAIRDEMLAQGALHPSERPASILHRIARPLTTVPHPSGRAVPLHLNQVTAPFVCEQINKLRDEYIRLFDEMAAGMARALEVQKLALEIALFRASIPAAAPAAGPTITARLLGRRFLTGGLSKAAAEAAFTGMRNGGGHAIRHLLAEGVIPRTGSLASQVEAFKAIVVPILRKPVGRAFTWRIGDAVTKCFLGKINGRWVATFVAQEGPYAGRVLSSLVPTPSNLALMLGRAGFAGI